MPRFASPVSAVIVCANERAVIADCIESVAFCAEIIVVDSGSTDGTLDIVKGYIEQGYPIRLIHHDWEDFAPQKQFALDQATQAWCLPLDADERVEEELSRSILAVIEKDDRSIKGWYVRRCDWLPGYGYAHKFVLNNRILRLFRRGDGGMDMDGGIHSSHKVKGRTAVIERGRLLHFREQTLEEETHRANKYSSGKAAMLLSRGRKPSTFNLFFKPPATFLKFYVIKRYFLCGRAGFIYSMMLMIYSFLTEAKLFRPPVKSKGS